MWEGFFFFLNFIKPILFWRLCSFPPNPNHSNTNESLCILFLILSQMPASSVVLRICPGNCHIAIFNQTSPTQLACLECPSFIRHQVIFSFIACLLLIFSSMIPAHRDLMASSSHQATDCFWPTVLTCICLPKAVYDCHLSPSAFLASWGILCGLF